jgi:hypothetical protein
LTGLEIREVPHLLKVFIEQYITHVLPALTSTATDHPAPTAMLEAGWSVALAHGLNRHHREDTKQDEDRWL